MDVQQFLDCGCTETNKPNFRCKMSCEKWTCCKARHIVAELNRPFPGESSKVVSKVRKGPTNAELAKQCGISKRQASKAVTLSTQTGRPLSVVIKSIIDGSCL